MSVILCRSLVS